MTKWSLGACKYLCQEIQNSSRGVEKTIFLRLQAVDGITTFKYTFCNLSFNATFLMVTILAKKSWPFVAHTVILWKILLKISQNHVCLWYGQLLLILTSPTLLRSIHTFSSEFWNQKSSLKNWLQPARWVTSFPLEFLTKWYQNDV